jgi:hypothetical protein
MTDLSPDIHPLYNFKTIFDIDFGLIRLIRDEYRANIFDLSVLDLPDQELKQKLVDRTDMNPLSICIETDMDGEEMMDLYNQFINQRYPDILERSAFTGIGELFVSSPVVLSDITTSVVFSNDLERAHLKKKLKEAKIDMEYKEYDQKNMNCKGFDPIVIKDCTELADYRNYDGHMIYLPRYGFTAIYTEEAVLLEPVRAFLLNQCQVNFIDIYKDLKHEIRKEEKKDE